MQHSIGSIIRAVLLGKCPRCQTGAFFATFWKNHDDCPHCNLHFEREAGYFLMSIFIAYLLQGVILVPLVITMFQTGVPVIVNILIGLAVMIAIAPFTYRYSRIFWLHGDWLFDPWDEL